MYLHIDNLFLFLYTLNYTSIYKKRSDLQKAGKMIIYPESEEEVYQKYNCVTTSKAFIYS